MSDADEPDGPAAVTTEWIVDAGVAIKWYVAEPFEAEAKRLLNPTFVLHVPELFFAEFGNYDCCDLALAIALDCRLVTADRPFYEAQRGGRHGHHLVWVADPR